MTRRTRAGLIWALGLTIACGDHRSPARGPAPPRDLPPDRKDAEVLGREVLELVDRAVDYRGAHRGRPAVSFQQMGIDTLTPTTVRRLTNVERAPVVTVAFRSTEGRTITSCRGDSQILEEATLNGGRFTLMCTTAAGAQRPMQVGKAVE